jgi:hypothetical protein
LFEVEGTITAIGQSIFDNNGTIYAYIEITDDSGVRTVVEKVAVLNDVNSRLHLGLRGSFFVDRIYEFSSKLRCQLWGIKADGMVVVDRKNIRAQTATIRFIMGIATLPLFGLGLVWIVNAVWHVILLCANDRNKMLGNSQGMMPTPLPQTVRI